MLLLGFGASTVVALCSIINRRSGKGENLGFQSHGSGLGPSSGIVRGVGLGGVAVVGPGQCTGVDGLVELVDHEGDGGVEGSARHVVSAFRTRVRVFDDGQTAIDGEEIEIACGDKAAGLGRETLFFLLRESGHVVDVLDEQPGSAHGFPHVVVLVGQQRILVGIECTGVVGLVDGVVVPVHHPAVRELVELAAPGTGRCAAVGVIGQSVVLQGIDGVEKLLGVDRAVEHRILGHRGARRFLQRVAAEFDFVGARCGGDRGEGSECDSGEELYMWFHDSVFIFRMLLSGLQYRCG